MESSQNTNTEKSQPSEITGFQKIYPNERDDNLPEVYVNDAPQAIPESEGHKAEVYSDVTSPKFSVADTSSTLKAPGLPDDGDRRPSDAGAGDEAGLKGGRRICGLRRKWFFVILGIVLVVVIAAGVGGGVGGAVASRTSGGGDEEQSSSPTSTSDSTSTATPTPTSAFLNNQTTPQDTFNFQGFSLPTYDGEATSIINDEGGTDFDFNITSYVWLPDDTGCCISFCKDETMEGMVGWRCGSRYQEDASEGFGRVYVWCGERQVGESARCDDLD